MPRTGCRSPLSWFAGPLLVSSLAAQQFSTADRQLAVAKIWAGARTNYAYNDRVRADWDSALTATLALATARQSDFQLYHRLRRMIALLNDGTAAIVPAAALRGRIARPPLELVSFEDRVFIADYAPNDEMRIARPERLAEIVAVQGIPTGTWIRDSVLPDIGGATPEARWHRAVAQMLEGEKGTAVHLQLRSPHPSADERGASVTRTISLDERWPFTRPALEVDTLPGGIAWVRLNSLADPNAPAVFDRTFPDFTKVTGVILDLRENTGAGGGRDDGYRILSRLMNRAFVTSRWRTALYRPALQGIDMPDSAGAWVVQS